MNQHCVYAFLDDAGQPYYIGQTYYFKKRFQTHSKRIHWKQPKYERALNLIRLGHPFTMVALRTHLTKKQADIIEMALIDYFPNLTNCFKKGVTLSSYKHGKIESRAYSSWQNMKQRCSNKKHPDYKRYGGRGITFCPSWKNFINFYDDMGEPPSDKYSLDRIDNNLGYCKENCRWATASQQARNNSRVHYVTYQGKTKSLLDWSEELDVSYTLLRKRLYDGWSVEKAFNTKPRVNQRILTYKGVSKNIRQWAKFLGINVKTFRDRINISGWSIEKAIETPIKRR